MAAADDAPAAQDSSPATPGAGWFNVPLDQVQPFDAAPAQGALAPRRKEALEGVSEKTKEALAKSDQPGRGWFNKGLDEIQAVEAPPPPPVEPPPPSGWQRLAESAAKNIPEDEDAESEVGAGEAGVSAITGLTAAPLGQGISTMASLAAGRGLNESVERGQKTAEALTYRPRSEQGQAAVEVANAPMQKLEEFADAVGQHLMEEGYTDPETGLSGAVNPAIAAGVKTAIMQLAMLAPFKGIHEIGKLGGDPLAQIPHQVIEAPHTVMDEAQAAAAARAKAAGGDNLSQVVAATQAEAEVGAHHDAAAVHATRQEAAKAAAAEEMANTEAQQAELQKDQDFGAAERQAGKTPGAVPSADEAFAQREQEGALAAKRAAAQKEQDFAAAKNQVGDQQVAAAENMNEGRAAGGAEEPKPTLAEALPPEQVNALQALRARLIEQKAGNVPVNEPSVAERLKAQHPEDDFQQLGPETPAKGSAKPEEEEPEGTRPPPQTPQTLAARRQQALDDAMAAKVRGQPAPAPEAAEAPEAPPNRLAAIKAAAEKRQQAPALPESKRAPPAGDPAEALFEQQVKEDADRAHAAQAAAEAQAGPGVTKGALAAKRAGAQRALPSAAQELIDELRAGRAKKTEESAGNFADVRRMNVWTKMNQDLKAARAKMEQARDAGDYQAYQKAADEHDAIRERVMRIARQENDTTRQRPVPPGSKPTGDFSAVPKGWEGIAEDTQRALAPTKEEATQHLQPMLDNLKPEHKAAVEIHAGPGTLPRRLLDSAREQNISLENARGVHDNQTGKVHIVASAHTDADDLQRTLIHELAHKGLRNLLGPEHGQVMQDIYDNIHSKESPLVSHKDLKTSPARKWMADYAEQHGFDLKQPAHQQHVADEYAAHLAEEPSENPGVLQRVIASVRAGLRKLGVVKEWTDNDIRELLRRSNNQLRDFRPDVAEKEDAFSVRWAQKAPDTDPTLPPTDPEVRAAKFGRTMEEQAGSGPSTLRSRLGLGDKATNLNAATMKGRLGFLHLDSLPDIVRSMSTPREFVKTAAQMFGRSGRLHEEGNKIALKWSRWANGGTFIDPDTGKLTRRAGQEDNGAALNTLMHSATLAGVHPDRAYEPEFTGDLTPDQKQSESLRRSVHGKLAEQYNKLDDEGRAIYQQVKQFYQDRRADVLRALEARIAETGASEQTKKQAMADLRNAFERGQVKGPYFPLMRFGEHWARAIDPETEQHYFSKFEDVAQRKRWMQRANELGYKTEMGSQIQDKSLMERIDPDFVKSVMSATEGNKELQDEIWQHYLKSMPEMSMRKRLIHRQGIPGYSEDALRGFAYNSFHMGHQIARLEYGNRMDSIVNNMDKEAGSLANANPDSNNALWGPALAAEFRRRLDWIKNPRASSTASALTKLGFNWFIGASPATAIRISTQNAMLAEPYLGARASRLGQGYNAGRAELWRAVGQWTRLKGGALASGKFGSSLGDALRGDERDMFDELRARGTFSSTASQTLASGGADRPIGVGAMDAFNRVSSYMFMAMEHKNRETTALAMYRIARKAGLSHEDATEEAYRASNQAHFNYANWNRPRVLQGDVAKVIGLFKQYPWQVTDRLARSFRDGVLRNPELSVAERNEQLKAFAGYMGKMMLFAGIKGVPILYHATMAAINGAFGDKDKPFDAEAALREHLEQHVGKTASDAVMDGPMSALTGAALSNGASYADLWYKQPNQDLSWGGTVADLMGQVGGPVPSIATEAAKGADIMAQHGDVERGLEHFAPPAINHLMKAARAAREGYTNLRGEQVTSPEELGQGWSTGLVGLQAVRTKNLMLQALGFSPEVYARQNEQNQSAQNFKQTLAERQKFLTEQYDTAVGRGDNAAAIKWMGEMQQFHKENPGLTWSAKGIVNGLRTREKQQATAKHGVNMPPAERSEYDKMTGAKP